MFTLDMEANVEKIKGSYSGVAHQQGRIVRADGDDYGIICLLLKIEELEKEVKYLKNVVVEGVLLYSSDPNDQ